MAASRSRPCGRLKEHLALATIRRYEQEMYRVFLRIAAWSILAAIIFVTVSPIDLRPTLGFGPNDDRAVGYFIVGLAFALAYPKHWLRTTLLVVLGAASIESLQLLTPDRHARLHDVLVKASGGMVGIAAGYAALRLRKPGKDD